MNQNLQEQLKLIVEHTLHESQTPGAAIAVHINGQAFLETSVGYQDLKHEVSLPTDANFYIYSITKSPTGSPVPYGGKQAARTGLTF